MFSRRRAVTLPLAAALVLWLAAGPAHAQGRGGCAAPQRGASRGTGQQLTGGGQQSAMLTALQQQQLTAQQQQQLTALLSSLQQQQLINLLTALQQQQLTTIQQQQVSTLLLALQQQQNAATGGTSQQSAKQNQQRVTGKGR